VHQHVSDHRGSIIREPCTMFGWKLHGWFYRVHWHGQGQCYGSIFWPVVRVCNSLFMSVFINSELNTHTHTQLVTICCHNTDLVHVNGHDRIIHVIFSQALYKAPWWWILCAPITCWSTFKYFIILIVSTYYSRIPV